MQFCVRRAIEALSGWCCAMYKYARVKQTKLLLDELQGSVPTNKSKRDGGFSVRNFKEIIEVKPSNNQLMCPNQGTTQPDITCTYLNYQCHSLQLFFLYRTTENT